MNRLIYTSSDEASGLAPEAVFYEGAAFRPVVWAPGVVFAQAVAMPSEHLACCRRSLRLSMSEFELSPAERSEPALDSLLHSPVISYKLGVWPRAVGWVAAIYAVRGAVAYMSDDTRAWRHWTVPDDRGGELLIRSPDPTWIPGTDPGSRYHILARTQRGIVGGRFVKLPGGAGTVRLRIEAPGDGLLLDNVVNAGKPLGWATYKPESHVSAQPKDMNEARARIAEVVGDILRLEKHL